ncbi:hypothetical protein FLW53_23400 [Microbispora sp. SCL1-1]|uniref:hypothetical protein n=1 Tax=unclassified Microbispora TaxID=2614687 RepID=UPI00115791DE|nr:MULTISPECIES: hypothetical protein [unclassified Microbispora]NJP27091.1 hypothetical protein [Microbispora sp. CL1-1]TQS11437.1 hypothetical protein FLW53_23400 [Microbispora sp. SCL1-1]
MTPEQAEEAPPGEPAELASLPVEVRAPVRALVHAVDQMRDHWAEADEARRRELWQQVHRAHDAVWGITVAVALARARV